MYNNVTKAIILLLSTLSSMNDLKAKHGNQHQNQVEGIDSLRPILRIFI